MNTAYVLIGELSGHNLIKLREPVPFEDGEIRIIIEMATLTGETKGKKFNSEKLVVRSVPPFVPLTRDEAHER